MRDKVLYIISWSALLMIATFPDLFKTGKFISMFNTENLKYSEGVWVILMPLYFAVMLAGIDVVYSYRSEKNKNRDMELIWVLVSILIFLLALAASAFYPNIYFTAACFYIAWLALTGMKFAATKKCEKRALVLRKIEEQ